MTLTEVIAVGVSQCFIGAIAAWLGQVWATRIAQNGQSRLDIRVKRLESELSTKSHLKRAKDENEVRLYAELWVLVHDALRMAIFLSNPYPQLAAPPGGLDQYERLWHHLTVTLGRNKPFYDHSVWQHTGLICSQIITIHQMILEGASQEKVREWIGTLTQDSHNLNQAIRHRVELLTEVPPTEEEKPEYVTDWLFSPIANGLRRSRK